MAKTLIAAREHITKTTAPEPSSIPGKWTLRAYGGFGMSRKLVRTSIEHRRALGACRLLRLPYEKYLYDEGAWDRTHGTAGRVPARVHRRILGDPGDGLRPIVRPPSGETIPPAERGVPPVPGAGGLAPRRDGDRTRVDRGLRGGPPPPRRPPPPPPPPPLLCLPAARL